jgi:hypothetical protein
LRTVDTPMGTLAIAETDFAEEPVAVIVKHPLEAAFADSVAPRLRRIADHVTGNGFAERLAFVDEYCLDRIPAAVTADLIKFAEEEES